ncbi:MAG: neuraminidase-like domain-containing protein [Chitinophagaceae bacterium]|jgi:hypothetical protein
MYPITPILTTGQQGPDIKNLQEILLYLLETGIINNQNTGIPVSGLQAEKQQSFFGDVTTQFVELFKTQYFLFSPPTQLVDGPVAGALNGFAGSQFPNTNLIVISGFARHVSGNPLPTNYTVRLEQKLFSSVSVLGSTTMDSSGFYSISFDSSSLTSFGDGYVLQSVVEVDIAEEYTSRQLLIRQGDHQGTIDVYLSNDIDITSEYEIVKTKVEALISSTDIKDIDLETDDSILILLVNGTGETAKDISDLVFAHRLSDQLNDLEPELFYGLLQMSLPKELEQLLFQPAVLMKSSFAVVMSNKTIDEYDETDLDTFISDLKSNIITRLNSDNGSDIAKSATFRIYNYVLNDTGLTNNFMAAYFKYEEQSGDDFWTYFEANFGSYSAYIKELKAVTVLAPMTGNNPAVVGALLDILNGGTFSGSETLDVISGEPQPPLLGGLLESNWLDIIEDAKAGDASNFIYPPFVQGNNDTQRNESYAERLYDNFTSVYTTYTINAQIATDSGTSFPELKDNLSSFLTDNPVFDVRTASILDLKNDDPGAPFDFSSVADRPAFIEEVATVQRLSSITKSYEAMTAMAADGIVSAFHVTTMAAPEFADKYEVSFGSTELAMEAYDLASTISTHVVSMAYEVYAGSMDAAPMTGGIDVYRWLDVEAVIPEDPYAEWRALFGSIDACNCCHCQSVYSPSAYLVDTLSFLKKNDVPGAVSAHKRFVYNRRPEIKHIELTCDNTNIPVPYIDIVNELLEDIVGSNAYRMLARQTKADAKHQRAIPEYINTDSYTGTWTDPDLAVADIQLTIDTPYGKLKDALYPWTLPYNFYKREIDTHLSIASVKGFEMIQRFSELGKLDAWDDIDYCTAYAGMSSEQTGVIITSATLTGPEYYGLTVFYGFTTDYDSSTSGVFRTTIPDPKTRGANIAVTSSNWLTKLVDRVDIFLQQTKLSYIQLLELLDCYFLNAPFGGGRQFAILNNSSTTNIATCKLYELRIDAANPGDYPGFLDKLHRFVRLARALKWSFYDLDKALLALAVYDIDDDVFKQIVQIKYLADTLKIPVEDVAIFYGNVENAPYRDYHHEDDNCELIDIPTQYTRVFRNASMLHANTDGPFPADGGSFTPVTKEIFLNYISGVINIKPSETQILLDDIYATYGMTPYSSITPSNTFISYIYRVSVLIKALKISVTDWLFYKKWLSDDDYFGSLSGSGNPADDTAAQPLEIQGIASPVTPVPFDTIRFISWVKLCKDAGIKTSTSKYLLLDAPENNIADDKSNSVLEQILTGLRAELFKLNYPDFDEADPNASQQLLGIIKRIMKDDQAEYMMKILDEALAATPAYSDEDREFISQDMSFFLPEGSDEILANANTSDPDYEDNIGLRYKYIYTNFSVYITESVLKPAIASYLAKEFKIEEGIAHVLLHEAIIVDTKTGFEQLLDRVFIEGNWAISRWGDTDEDAFSTILLMHKASILINQFNLGINEIRYLWVYTIDGSGTPGDPVIPGIPILSELPIRTTPTEVFVPGTSSTITFRLLRNIIQWMQVRAFTGQDINILFEALKTSSVTMIDQIASVFKIGKADADALLTISTGILQLDSESYSNPRTYLRLIDCLEMQHLLTAPMNTLAGVAEDIKTSDSQENVAPLIHLVRASFETNQWLEVIQPVNDVLRVERRDALVAFMLAFPPTEYRYAWQTSNDIYETLMVDVEMMPIMSTTRVLLAVNSIQLWMDRILLRLEEPEVTDKVARQWLQWRKLYRLWEANRKVYIYPENWIEPELRDNKSPFFVELEKFLKQNEVTKENVEEAYKIYLERLDQVADLDIIGMYRETTQSYQSFSFSNNDVIHAFGRTKESPHIYFYRKRAVGEWTPWEKMDVQVEGDHFIPVMWRGRLRFYWLMFIKEQAGGSINSARSSSEFVPPAAVHWKIHLAWTELKDNKWIAKQVSKDAVYSRYIIEEEPISLDHAKAFSAVDRRTWNGNDDLNIIKKESINFICNHDTDGNLSFNVIERDYGISADNMRLSSPVSPGGYVGTIYENVFNSWGWSDWTTWVNAPDRYWAHIGKFVCRFNGVSALPGVDAGPVIPSLYNDYAGSIDKKDLLNNRYWPEYTDYWYRREPEEGYAHFPDGNIQLLRYAPGHNKATTFWPGTEWDTKVTILNKYKSKYLVFPRQVPMGYDGPNIQIPYFFYKDQNNTFFVEKVSFLDDLVVVDAGGSITGHVGGAGTIDPSAGTPVKVDRDTLTGITVTGGVTSSGTPITFTGGADSIGGSVSFASEVFGTFALQGYRFHTFKHNRINDFQERLHTNGLDGLLDRGWVMGLGDSILFDAVYDPTENVDRRYPSGVVDFSTEGALSLYNWELFFHIPMLIANKLSQNQQFDEARKWYHYVFNPTANDDDPGTLSVKRYWNFGPFYNMAASVPTIDEVMNSPKYASAIAKWAEDPFKPHLVARTRPSAYMKNAVIKYLDNLIAWGDNLFRTDSREAINEATLLYVIALQILGRKPEDIPTRSTPVFQTYATLAASGINDFGNAMVGIENILLSSGAKTHFHLFPVSRSSGSGWFFPLPSYYPPGSFSTYDGTYVPLSLTGSMYYFCTPINEKQLQYWDILADRLFKIRNSMNIDGVTRELALFDPPIDPAILVKAAAAGVSLAGVLGDLTAPLPSYRFNVMSQKASELVQEVKSLGGQLLSALEKKDSERISLLRSTQEIKVLEAITELKQKQIQESSAQFDGLQVQLKSTTQRRDYYQNLVNSGLIGKEQLQIDKLKGVRPLLISQGATQGLSSTFFAIPEFNIGPFIAGLTAGGQSLGHLTAGAASVQGIFSSLNSNDSQMASLTGGFERREQDWKQQLKTANIEIEQLGKQIIAAEIRKAMSEVELKNHQLQLQNAQEMEIAMRDKYTNEELYDWMIGQISFTYFQGYKLAYDTAKKAERCFRYELNLDTSDYIQYGYWDSLNKGLLAGENLAYDIKRMEAAYLDKNKRQLELTKHVSLAALDPTALMNLRINQHCEIEIPEWLYDMDYPGQHMRRIKSVSVSIPCVAGPYTTISCKLSLNSSRYRKNAFGSDDYPEDPNDTRFNYMFGNIQSIATSNAQNDSGMFEMNFRDERYLPFEGCGAISKWSIDLPAAYAQFDYNTISDLIFHIKYTAQDSGSLKTGAIANITDMMENTGDVDDKGLYRVFNLKQEFSNEWHQLLNGTATDLVLPDILQRLPYLVQGLDLLLSNVVLFINKQSSGLTVGLANDPDDTDVSLTRSVINDYWEKYTAPSDPGIALDQSWFISGLTPATISEAWIILQYKKD